MESVKKNKKHERHGLEYQAQSLKIMQDRMNSTAKDSESKPPT